MAEDYQAFGEPRPQVAQAPWKMYLTHLILFVLTFLTTTLAGVQWLNADPLELANFPLGLTYAVLILLMLSAHEFGHYFAARYHGVPTTLPFYLPFPGLFAIVNFGTFGAVIRIRSSIPSRKVLFDIGAAGPIAGFVASMVILIYGFATIPPIEYLYSIHPEYSQMVTIPEGGLRFGNSLLFSALTDLAPPPGAFVPPMNEVYHYPFLCVGWFGLFVTAFNLVPIGQLDGGHISYAMFGNTYHKIAQVALVGLVLLGLAAFLPMVGVDPGVGWFGYLFGALILILLLKAKRLKRPPIADDTPLDPVRLWIGWACFAMFILCFAPTPFAWIGIDSLF
jgi:membrane-associated protease RseP (regulator of RpoE activity)